MDKKFEKIAILYHDFIDNPQDSVGHIASYATERAICTDYFCTQNDELPEGQSLHGYDVIFVMGAVNGKILGDDLHEWLLRETAMITDAVHNNQKVIGLGFGAVLLAMILGTKIIKSKNPEIGFLPISFISGEENPLLNDLPDNEIFFISKEYGFHVPITALDMAFSEDCVKDEFYDQIDDVLHHGHLAFVSNNVLAMAFQPEVTPLMINYYTQFYNHIESNNMQSSELIKMLSSVYSCQIGNHKDNCARNILFHLLDKFLL